MTGPQALTARDAFALLWDGAVRPDTADEHVDAAGLVPGAWLPYLLYTTLNPLQRHALPVAFALVANSPHLFTRLYRVIAGVPAASLYSILDESTRYFSWLAAQGLLGTVPPVDRRGGR